MFDSIKVSNLEKQLEDKNQRIRDLEAENKAQQKEYESNERILRNELQIEVNKAVTAEKENTQKVQQENAVLKKEVEILEKAFENMGFDVKDMKEILNKLVDGLIAKNEIKLVK